MSPRAFYACAGLQAQILCGNGSVRHSDHDLQSIWWRHQGDYEITIRSHRVRLQSVSLFAGGLLRRFAGPGNECFQQICLVDFFYFLCGQVCSDVVLYGKENPRLAIGGIENEIARNQSKSQLSISMCFLCLSLNLGHLLGAHAERKSIRSINRSMDVASLGKRPRESGHADASTFIPIQR